MVSVNCITYNHEPFIEEAIKGFLMQKTDFEFEILIGEDCSTDHTLKIVKRYVEKYPNKIRLITSSENVGGRANSIRLQQNAKGKYIAICEGDDFWTDPYKLQKQVDYMEQNPTCTLCFHAADILGSQERKKKRIRPYVTSRVSLMEDIISDGGFCPSASLLYPKVIMDNPPEYYLTAHVGDYPMQMYAASQGYAYYIDECMSVYRTDVRGSWTSRMNSGKDNKEKVASVYRQDIQLLLKFNEQTRYQYNQAVKIAIIHKEIGISLIEGDASVLRNMGKQKDLREKCMKDKVKMYTLRHFPKSYLQMMKIKELVMNG